jgi:hypothetical protein
LEADVVEVALDAAVLVLESEEPHPAATAADSAIAITVVVTRIRGTWASSRCGSRTSSLLHLHVR